MHTRLSLKQDRGDVPAARALYAQALATYNTIGSEFGAADVLGNMAELEFADGHPAEAVRFIREALEIRCATAERKRDRNRSQQLRGILYRAWRR